MNAFDLGFLAANREAPARNPFVAGTRRYFDWRAGWRAAAELNEAMTACLAPKASQPALNTILQLPAPRQGNR